MFTFPSLAYHCVHLPVSEFLSGVDVLWPLLYACACVGSRLPADFLILLFPSAFYWEFLICDCEEYPLVDVTVKGRLADLCLKFQPLGFNLSEDCSRRVSVLCYLCFYVLCQSVVFAYLKVWTLVSQVLLVLILCDVWGVSFFLCQIRIGMCVCSSLYLTVYGADMNSYLVSDFLFAVSCFQQCF